MDNQKQIGRRVAALAPVPAALERTPPAVSWDELDEAEHQALVQGEAHVMALFDERVEEPEASDQSAVSSWRFAPWQLALGMACCFALVFAGRQLYSPEQPVTHNKAPIAWPTLQTEGHAKLRWRHTRDTKTALLEIDVPTTKRAQVADPKHWALETQGGTQLTLARQSRRVMEVKLKRGALVAHVTPNVMKEFAVRCRGQFDVLVKGTVFAVRQGPQWLRVEVMRGRVEVRRRGQIVAVVNAGEGVRFAKQNPRPRRYAVLPQAKRSLAALLRWMRVHAPQELERYAQDLATQQTWGQRRAALETIANLLARQRRYLPASKIWSQLYRWKPDGFEGQTALFQAAQHCRRGQPTSLACVRLYQLWLKRFPKGMAHLHEASMYGLLRIFHKRGTTRERNKLIRAYLKRHPKGAHRGAVRLMGR